MYSMHYFYYDVANFILLARPTRLYGAAFLEALRRDH
jgi:hypothetical protein